MTRWWIELARTWLRLPPGDAALPGDPKRRVTWNPDGAYLRYSLLGLLAGSLLSFPIGLALLGGGVVAIVSALTEGGDASGAIVGGLFACAIGGFTLLSIAFRYAIIKLELDMLRYTLTDQALRLRRGVMAVEEVTLSYVNVQNVKFVQGPLQRYFGIADLLVETAGGGGMMTPQGQQQQMLAHRGLIKGISQPEKLRDMILDRVRQAKGGGLGDAHDDDDDASPRGDARGLSSPAALALLAEIRDGLAAANEDLARA